MSMTMMKKVHYISSTRKIKGLSEQEKDELEKVEKEYPFRANDYYLGLIDWNDKNDPIRRIVVPCSDELQDGGLFDPSDEKKNYVAKGVQHKYKPTVLFLVSDVCGSYCRYCFRKRLFKHFEKETTLDVSDGLDYIKQHEEVNNVLLTGGDPLILSTDRLDYILTEIRKNKHIKSIRIGTKMLSFNPFRVLEDPNLVTVLGKHSLPDAKIYLVTHFSHSRELTPEAIRAVNMLRKVNVSFSNQTPMIRGVNDTPEVLAKLLNTLAFIGVPPYYVFQCRPSKGNKCFAIPIEETYRVFEKTKSMVSGLAGRAKLIMSHATGKIEIVGADEEKIYFKYHSARDAENASKFFSVSKVDDARWLDDYDIDE